MSRVPPGPGLTAVLAVALAVRVAVVLLVEVDPRVHWAHDMSWYDGVARRLLGGRGYTGYDGAPTAAWPPGYPAFLAALYAAFGPSLLAAKLANALLGTGTVLLTWLLGREVGLPRAALLAAALLAVFPGHVLFTPTILSEPLYGFLVCLALWLFVRRCRAPAPGVGGWVALGALVGAMSLVRGTAVFLVPTFALAWLARGMSPGAAMRATVAAAAGVLLVLVPWTARNHVRLGYPVLIASDGAVSLWVGNSDVADGSHTLAMRPVWYARFGHLLALPNPQEEVEVARAQMREALGWMVRHPHRVLALVPAKIYHMYRDDRGAYGWIHRGLGKLRLGRRFLAGVDGYYFVVLALALLGVRHALRGDAGLLPIAVAVTTLGHALLFFGGNRFHYPLLPMLCLLAAAEIVAWTRRPATTPRTA